MKRASTGRLRMKLLVPAAAVLCSAIALVTSAVSAGAAQPQGPQNKTLAVTYKISPVSALPPNAQPALKVECGPKLNDYDRTQLCWDGTLTFTFRTDGKPVGTLVAELVQYIDLNPHSDVWAEDDTVTRTVATGTTAPVYVNLIASCNSPCEATALFSGVITVGLSGTVVYIDTIANGHEHTTPTHYILDYDAPPYIPISDISWTSPASYRCDQGLAAKGTGCVFPKFTPTLVLSRKQSGASAAMFQWAQQNMSAHWGLRGRGEPLTRASGSAGAKNQKKVCDSTFRNLGRAIGGPGDKDSCDEFPYASTNQSGAAKLGKPPYKNGAACAQLEAVHTARKGTEAVQWNSVKVLGKPNYNAPCVRGHIPGKLNSSTGGAYIAFAQNQRLIIDDPQDSFWVAVTA